MPTPTLCLEILDQILSPVTTQDLLSCRRVCQSWCLAASLLLGARLSLLKRLQTQQYKTKELEKFYDVLASPCTTGLHAQVVRRVDVNYHSFFDYGNVQDLTGLEPDQSRVKHITGILHVLQPGFDTLSLDFFYRNNPDPLRCFNKLFEQMVQSPGNITSLYLSAALQLDDDPNTFTDIFSQPSPPNVPSSQYTSSPQHVPRFLNLRKLFRTLRGLSTQKPKDQSPTPYPGQIIFHVIHALHRNLQQLHLCDCAFTSSLAHALLDCRNIHTFRLQHPTGISIPQEDLATLITSWRSLRVLSIDTTSDHYALEPTVSALSRLSPTGLTVLELYSRSHDDYSDFITLVTANAATLTSLACIVCAANNENSDVLHELLKIPLPQLERFKLRLYVHGFKSKDTTLPQMWPGLKELQLEGWKKQTMTVLEMMVRVCPRLIVVRGPHTRAGGEAKVLREAGFELTRDGKEWTRKGRKSVNKAKRSVKKLGKSGLLIQM